MKKNGKPIHLPSVLGRQDGMVLFSTLLILLSVSLIAVGMSNDTASDVRISGNRRMIEQSFQLADGATNLGVQVLLDHLDDAVNPGEDYPSPGATFSLVGGKLFLENLQLDEEVYADIQGYEENDNEADPENGSADISFRLTAPSESHFGTTEVVVDIDRLGSSYLPGSSIEFAGGYEGVGKGAGAGSVAVYYAVRAQAKPQQANLELESEVTTVYRKVSHVVGGGGGP
jgi:hypothetical protein